MWPVNFSEKKITKKKKHQRYMLLEGTDGDKGETSSEEPTLLIVLGHKLPERKENSVV